MKNDGQNRAPDGALFLCPKPLPLNNLPTTPKSAHTIEMGEISDAGKHVREERKQNEKNNDL